MQKINIKKMRKNNLKNFNFGRYLQLVEECVFNSESLLERKNKELSKIKKKSISENSLFAFVVFSFVLCPLILMALSLNNKGLVEMTAYALWLIGGIFFLKNHIKSYISRKQERQKNREDIRFAVSAALDYTKSVCDAFFNRKQEINHNLKDISEDDLNRLKLWTVRLEIDFLLLEEMVYKHQKLNEKTIIIDPSEYQAGREVSQQYITQYLETLTQNHRV